MSRTVFLSYSSQKKSIKDLFKLLLESMGLTVDMFDEGVDRPSTAEQADRILSCDGFIAIISEDEGTLSHVSPNVVIEIGLADNRGYPMQLFAIDDVKLEAVPNAKSQTPARIKVVEKEGGGFLLDANDVEKIWKTLLGFSKRLENIGGHAGEERIFYKSFQIQQKMVSRDRIDIRNTVTAMKKTEFSNHTHEGTLFCDRGQENGVMVDPENFRFSILEPHGYADPKIDWVENGREKFRFRFHFDPPIVAGNDVRYVYERTNIENFFPYTIEELDKAISDKLIKHQVMREKQMIGQDFRVTRPTDKLIMEMVFPKSYRIKEEDIEVVVCEEHTTDMHESETIRAKKFVALDCEPFDKICTLRLELDHPILHCNYFLLYRPPSEATLG